MLPGTRLGPHEILIAIGAGGMGEVYRARDTTLDRDVALKILPASFATDPDRLMRFTREAKTLASLNHPNIAQIYGIEETDGVRALVMELVEGEDLSAVIAGGPLALADALPIAKQIADALEAAHEQGIIHRDLKPANVKVRDDGTVKVLDFGLAKALATDGTSTAAESVSMSPTLTSPAMTAMGMILGTAAYMSPEQAAGKAVDKRSDIWSFGVVLYEMLTGERLFAGETISHTLADVLRAPIDFGKLPASTPAPIAELLTRCLDRTLKARLRDIGEARIALDRGLAHPGRTAAQATTPSLSRPRLRWVAAVAIPSVVAAALAFVHFREKPPVTPVQRFTVALPQNGGIYNIALSPDGSHVVMAAIVSDKPQLWLRALDTFEWQPMAFTDGATYPFWSPDSRFIAFFADGKLKKIAATGGPAQALCDAPDGRGGSWSRDDVILFTPAYTGVAIQRVPAAGGVPADVTKTRRGERFPFFLPDGRHFLYLFRSGTSENGIYLSSLDGMEPRRILPDVSSPVFAPPPSNGASGTIGHVLFVRDRTLMAQPFDTRSSEPAGEAFPVADGVTTTMTTFYTPATVSDRGILLYASDGAAVSNQLVWYDRRGTVLGRVGAPGNRMDPDLSPSEQSVAFRRTSRTGYDLWLWDLPRGTETRLTTEPSFNLTPVWSPRGDRIVFSSNRRAGVSDLFEKVVGTGGEGTSLVEDPNAKFPTQWSPDGRFVVYTVGDPRNKWDIWVVPMDGPETGSSRRTARPFLQGPDSEVMGQLSPDGRWMAYVSDQSGRREVYVRAFPSAEGQVMVSAAGGEMPRWRRDGQELFFVVADGRLMAVPVRTGAGPKPALDAGAAVALFDAPIVRSTSARTVIAIQYSVTADGQRFLINTASGSGDATAPPLNVVVNWRAGATTR